MTANPFNAVEKPTTEKIITIAPQKIRNSISTMPNTQSLPLKYNRAEAFVTIATQHTWCFCKCYNPDSIDARCCGACYKCCPSKTFEQQCNFCPNDFTTYWDSGYVQTVSGYGGKAGAESEKNGVYCCICFPLKFAMFFSCCFGSMCNGCINYMRDTNMNYLF